MREKVSFLRIVEMMMIFYLSFFSYNLMIFDLNRLENIISLLEEFVKKRKQNCEGVIFFSTVVDLDNHILLAITS